MLPKHTPYANSSKPFEIGLRPFDPANWLAVDDHLGRYLQEKRRLMEKIPDKLFVAEEGSEEAQQEVLELLIPYLLETHPDIWSREGDMISVFDYEVDLTDDTIPDLLKAAYLVQEDFVLMRNGDNGWRLVAASVCFPSSWVLLEKFGKPMHEIHAPVPGFSEGTRNAAMIERIFDNLLVDKPVERFNWSVYNDDQLYHDDRSGDHFPDNEKIDANEYFLRVEHQTLRKLPKSGDILFSIGIYIDPIELLEKRKDKAELIPGFIKSIGSMNALEMKYKGFDRGCGMLIKRLEGMLE